MSQFPFMKGKLSLHLLDVSPKMRELQCRTLCACDLYVDEAENPRPRASFYGDVLVSWHKSLGKL